MAARLRPPSGDGAVRRSIAGDHTLGKRRQDSLNPQKYRYLLRFSDLPEHNTHLEAIVLFRLRQDADGRLMPNNYIVTAYQKHIG